MEAKGYTKLEHMDIETIRKELDVNYINEEIQQFRGKMGVAHRIDE